VLTLYDYFADIKSEEDLIPPGAKPGTVPTDVEQATGLERLELIGKMQGIDIFDMRPLDASRKGMLISLHEMRRRSIVARV
jgi:cytochrome c oxidase subunit 5b